MTRTGFRRGRWAEPDETCLARPTGQTKRSYFLCSSFLTSFLISFFSGTEIHLLPYPGATPEGSVSYG